MTENPFGNTEIRFHIIWYSSIYDPSLTVRYAILFLEIESSQKRLCGSRDEGRIPEADMEAIPEEKFLLGTKTARDLFRRYAKDAPIIDYHSHIDAREIAEDVRFENITQLWLYHDHYKWRLMRAAGVDERLITGDATDREKFDAWAFVLGRAVGNPLFVWSQMELRKYFGYTGVLSEKTADEVWTLTERVLAGPDMSARGIIARSNVEILCTTDDPVDSLEAHRQILEDPSVGFQVLPTFRPDRVLNIEKPEFFGIIEQLEDVCERKILKYDDLERALRERMAYFAENGCRLSDLGLERFVFEPASRETINRIFTKRLGVITGVLTETEIAQFKTAIMLLFAREASALGWTMQIHFGCRRDNNSAMYEILGPNTGFDAISGGEFAAPAARFLDTLEREDQLPRMIFYSLNPNDNEILDSLIGCFQKGPEIGRLQHGAAWWFNDCESGIREHLTGLANNGYLPAFVGMLTDSRSFLSYSRHEYFRRILCGMLGQMVENGMYPADMELLGGIIGDVCYHNPKRLLDP